MREIRQSGSEGGAIQTNVSFLPLYCQGVRPCEWVPDQVRNDTVVIDAGSKPGMTPTLGFTFTKVRLGCRGFSRRRRIARRAVRVDPEPARSIKKPRKGEPSGAGGDKGIWER